MAAIDGFLANTSLGRTLATGWHVRMARCAAVGVTSASSTNLLKR